MAADTVVKTLDYTEASGRDLDAAVKLASAILAEEEAVKAAVAPCLEQIKQASLIQANEVDGAREKLSSHLGALDVIQNLLNIRSREKAAWAKEAQELSQKIQLLSQGHSVAKTASTGAAAAQPGQARLVKTANSHNPGQILGENEYSESDLILMKGAGCPIPEGLL